jgi:hypothetical protein
MKIYAVIVLAITICDCKEEAASGVTNKGGGIGTNIQIKVFIICSFCLIWIPFMFELVNINLIRAI